MFSNNVYSTLKDVQFPTLNINLDGVYAIKAIKLPVKGFNYYLKGFDTRHRSIERRTTPVMGLNINYCGFRFATASVGVVLDIGQVFCFDATPKLGTQRRYEFKSVYNSSRRRRKFSGKN